MQRFICRRFRSFNPGTSGIYTLTNPTLGEAYVGSAVDGNARLSNSKHEKAQRLLNHKDTKIEFREVDLGTADSRRDKGNILRHYEQKDLEALKRKKKFTILNSNNPEAKKKNKRNRVLVEEHGASRKKKQTYQKK